MFVYDEEKAVTLYEKVIIWRQVWVLWTWDTETVTEAFKRIVRLDRWSWRYKELKNQFLYPQNVIFI